MFLSLSLSVSQSFPHFSSFSSSKAFFPKLCPSNSKCLGLREHQFCLSQLAHDARLLLCTFSPETLQRLSCCNHRTGSLCFPSLRKWQPSSCLRWESKSTLSFSEVEVFSYFFQKPVLDTKSYTSEVKFKEITNVIYYRTCRLVCSYRMLLNTLTNLGKHWVSFFFLFSLLRTFSFWILDTEPISCKKPWIWKHLYNLKFEIRYSYVFCEWLSQLKVFLKNENLIFVLVNFLWILTPCNPLNVESCKFSFMMALQG